MFQDEPVDLESNASDYDVEDSRRILNNQYEKFLNRNYAARRHLG